MTTSIWGSTSVDSFKYDKASTVFVPAIGGVTTGITTSTNTLNYTRICDVLHFTGFIKLLSKASLTGTFTLTGFPFPVDVTSNVLPVISMHCSAMATTLTAQPMGIFTDANTLQFYYTVSGVATSITATDMLDTAAIRVSGFYRIAV